MEYGIGGDAWRTCVKVAMREADVVHFQRDKTASERSDAHCSPIVRAPSSMNLEILLSVDRNAPWWIHRCFIYVSVRFVLWSGRHAGTTGRFCSYAIREPHLSSVLSSRAKRRGTSSIWINSLIHEGAGCFVIFLRVSFLVNCRISPGELVKSGRIDKKQGN